MIKTFTVLALVAFSTQALANQEEAKKIKASTELPAIEALIGKNLKVARAYTSKYDGQQRKIMPVANDEYVDQVMDSYAYGDINGDGNKDLAVAVEMPPTTDKDGFMSFGKRSLRIYLGDRNGKLTLVARGSGAVLTGDEGGAMGDPLQTVEISSRGVVSVNHWGGSAQKWGVTQKFQMRKGDVVVIGRTENDYDGISGESHTEDINFITGDKIVSDGDESTDKPAKVKKSKIAVKPLVKLAKAKVWAD